MAYNSTASGVGSSAYGTGSLASGLSSSAYGAASVASGDSSAAYSFNSNATGAGSSAYCTSSLASGTSSTAVGAASAASGANSAAYGFFSRASGASSVAIGDSAQATQTGAIAIGLNSQSIGTNSIAIGTGAVATGSIAGALTHPRQRWPPGWRHQAIDDCLRLTPEALALIVLDEAVGTGDDLLVRGLWRISAICIIIDGAFELGRVSLQARGLLHQLLRVSSVQHGDSRRSRVAISLRLAHRCERGFR
jgi:hypothetical protein